MKAMQQHNSSHEPQSLATQPRKKYVRPTVKVYGGLRELTQSGITNTGEGKGGGNGKKP